MKYAIIIGQGRSGTNWLNELLDLSDSTYCRNEPHELIDSPVSILSKYRELISTDSEYMETHWDDLMEKIGSRMGEIDFVIKVKKNYFRQYVQSFGFYRMFHGPKARYYLRSIFSSLKGDEWPIPSFILNLKKWNNCLKVFKFVQAPGWAGFLLKNRPDIPVLHIVRHPGGFLNSWSQRYLSLKDKQKTLDDCRERIKRLVAHSESWKKRIGDVDRLDLDTLELWYWCYANRELFELGQKKPNYILISYEELATEPVKVMKKIYSSLGLDFTPEIESKINSQSVQSVDIAYSWEKKMSEVQKELSLTFVRESGLSHLWTKSK